MKSYKSIIALALFAGLALTTTSCIGDWILSPMIRTPQQPAT